jgi:signal transduction histidine kinase
MLQHSRGAGGVKQPTDINNLCDEFFRLAYHGCRAKDTSFNVTMLSDFDPVLEKASVVPQEIGRVVLNLINNAFHAVSDRKKKELQAFEPTVWLKTRKMNGKIEIRVKDNGSGIPASVVSKIFEPFFTTKPTGEGIGLGLSLSFEIIQSHKGEIKVESKEGEGTEFMVVLPVN